MKVCAFIASCSADMSGCTGALAPGPYAVSSLAADCSARIGLSPARVHLTMCSALDNQNLSMLSHEIVFLTALHYHGTSCTCCCAGQFELKANHLPWHEFEFPHALIRNCRRTHSGLWQQPCPGALLECAPGSEVAQARLRLKAARRALDISHTSIIQQPPRRPPPLDDVRRGTVCTRHAPVITLRVLRA